MPNFIQLNKCEETNALLKDHPNEYLLLSLVALRAKRTDNPIGLEIGQAFIGDFKCCGLTRQKYRSALKNLKKWHFLTIQATNKGTIVTLLDPTVFDINEEESNQQINQQATNKQPTSNQQATTNNKEDLLLFKEKGSLKDLFLSLNKRLHHKRHCIETNGYLSKIKARLKNFTKEEIIQAADNMVSDPFMMGDNKNNRKYATLEYLVRDDENVRKWLEEAPGKVSRLMKNLDVDNLED